jgi:hypothetical protein
MTDAQLDRILRQLSGRLSAVADDWAEPPADRTIDPGAVLLGIKEIVNIAEAASLTLRRRAEHSIESGQMLDVNGLACDVHSVRVLRDGRELGAGYDVRDPATWYVYSRMMPGHRWQKHCGPYSSCDQALAWIDAIREEA